MGVNLYLYDKIENCVCTTFSTFQSENNDLIREFEYKILTLSEEGSVDFFPTFFFLNSML